MASDERLYFVAYDISSPARWRKVFTTMQGYGEHVQLSVFQCRLTRMRYAQLAALLDEFINHREDHVVMIDLGKADQVEPKVHSLGKRSFAPVKREPVIV